MSRSDRARSSRAICRWCCWCEAIKGKKPTPAGFYDAGTQIVTANSVDMGPGLPKVTFAELEKLAADPKATADYLQGLDEDRCSTRRRLPACRASQPESQ